MSQIFQIENDKVVIQRLALENLEGNVTHTGNLSLNGPVEVTGTLTVDTLKVKNIEAEKGVTTKFGEWNFDAETELQGQGLSWTHAHGETRLFYRTGGRLWLNGDFDLDTSNKYMIDNVPVLSKTELGSQVTKSNLRQVGTLNSLNVTGNTALAEFAYFNSISNRLGLNTSEPRGTFSVSDNNAEFVINSPRDGIIQLGAVTNHDVEIITDDTARVKFKNNGQVVFGNENSKNADVRIYGTLTVDSVVSDNRIDRNHPLEFKESREHGIYGQGLIWTGAGSTRKFLLSRNPDRFTSTESIDLSESNSYFINGDAVISATTLGTSVVHSNLRSLGTLDSLTVSGESTFYERINASRVEINAKIIRFTDGNEFAITNSKLSGNTKLSFDVNNDEVFYADSNEIAIGNKENNRKPIKVFGQLSVGVNNPDPTINLAVKGDIGFNNVRFTTGSKQPTEGSFNRGDICWNNNPVPGNYIGWVCIQPGTPGSWAPFGAIVKP